MTLAAGTRIGAYEVVAKLGEGGMGEVYRAHDTKLGRDVAIKVLSSSFVSNPERVARFQREAQILATLNHPHIGAIYGLETVDGLQFLVLELVEGETLADRLASSSRLQAPAKLSQLDSGPGPRPEAQSPKPGARHRGLPIDEVIRIARQIADALETAHEKGVVHRDLKPANIAITADNQIKVLDFGLARMDVPDAGRSGDVGESPTLTFAGTQVGMILGTAAYMSPEQAKGRVADKRTDVWGFGCVLYEMLAGRRAFDGEDATEVIAAVVRGEPDWSALPGDVPLPVRVLLKRCLEKDRRARISDIAVARFVFAEFVDTTTAALTPATERGRSRSKWMVAGTSVVLASLAVAVLALWRMFQQPITQPRATPIRFALFAGTTAQQLSDREVAISSDGTLVAYRSGPSIVIHDLSQLEARVVPGTNAGRMPFFSPDSRWLGFFTTNEIRKVPVAGGVATTLAPIGSPPRGGVWTKDDTIIFSLADGGGMRRLAASGGEVTALAKPAEAQTSYNYPALLPNGRAVLFTVGTVGGPMTTVNVLDFSTGEQKKLIDGAGSAQYADGFLVYSVDRNLYAVPFDEDRLAVTGEAVPVLEDVMTFSAGSANFALSPNGSLVYAPSARDVVTPRTLVWVDRKGSETPLNAPPRSYVAARLSPDGTKIVLDIRDQQFDIWTWDIRREAMTRVTFDPTVDMCPIWTLDGRRILWASLRATGIPVIFTQAADGTGTNERLASSMTTPIFPTSMSPDGKVIIWENAARTSQDILALDLRTQQTTSLISTPAAELDGEISPDGQWLAYESNESGRVEIYIRPYPDVNSGRWQISTTGGTRPAWSPRGNEIFYMDSTGGLTSVGIDRTRDTIVAGRPQQLFATKYHPGFTTLGLDFRGYDVARDGQRFLMIKEPDVASPPDTRRMVVVLNWTEELRTRMAKK